VKVPHPTVVKEDLHMDKEVVEVAGGGFRNFNVGKYLTRQSKRRIQ
jgi:hypothetical protein